jgi:hypothetical protein
MNKDKSDKPKPLINHRWQLPCLQQMLDELLPVWPEGKHPDFSDHEGHARLRAGFQRFGERLLWELSLVLEKAAGRGITEALAFITNPDYHKTVKRRRKREIQRDKEYQERQQKERERWQRCEFTEEEKVRELGRIAYEKQYHQKQLEQLNARQLRVETSNPIEPDTVNNKPDDDDFWSNDTILFD